MINLGRLQIRNKLILAPISMYSDIGFRKVCYDYGAGYGFTERIYAEELIAAKRQITRKIDFFDEAGLQLLTNNPAELSQAIKIVNEKKIYPNLENIKSIDLNLGCPTRELIKQNMGAALLNQHDKVRQLFRVMRKTTELPISAKIRLGLNPKHKKEKPYLAIARIAAEEGLDFITVHARDAWQLYSGKVDYSALKEIKDQVKIPLVGNGGVVNEETAQKMLRYCDAIMIGQQALHSPFIFKQIEYFMKTGRRMEISIETEKKKTIKKYFEYALYYDIGFQRLKIHTQAFLKGMPNSSKLVAKLTSLRNKDDLMDAVSEYLYQ